MAYRKILMPLMGAECETRIAKTCLAFAKSTHSQVEALYVPPDPARVVASISPDLPSRIIQELVDAARGAAEEDIASIRTSLQTAARTEDVSLVVQATSDAACSLRVEEGDINSVIAEKSLFADLVVFQHPGEDDSKVLRSSVEVVLLGSRRPVLLLTSDSRPIIGEKIAIGWDGSISAAQAVSNALPVLKRASAVEMISVNANAEMAREADALREYLALHGVQATERRVRAGAEETGAVLLDVARRNDAGCLVLGAYAHSRLREFVLGGVTRHVLTHPILPLFMVH